MLDKIKLQLDSSSFHLGYVKFFQKDSQFFANIENITLLNIAIRLQIFGHNTDRFVVREQQCNTNISHGIVPMLILYNFNKSRNFYYFNKGTEDLRKLNYINLKRNLSDNIDSRLHLKKYINKTLAGIAWFERFIFGTKL